MASMGDALHAMTEKARKALSEQKKLESEDGEKSTGLAEAETRLSVLQEYAQAAHLATQASRDEGADAHERELDALKEH